MLAVESESRLGRFFEIHQTMDVILPGKSRNLSLSVLLYSSKKISGYAGIQNSGSTREDVDMEVCCHKSLTDHCEGQSLANATTNHQPITAGPSVALAPSG